MQLLHFLIQIGIFSNKFNGPYIFLREELLESRQCPKRQFFCLFFRPGRQVTLMLFMKDIPEIGLLCNLSKADKECLHFHRKPEGGSWWSAISFQKQCNARLCISSPVANPVFKNSKVSSPFHVFTCGLFFS